MANVMTKEELDRRIKERAPHSEAVREGMELVERARTFAIKNHGDQKYDTEPYSVHLDAVENVLIEFDHISSVLRAAAWLHDLVEDTNVSQAEIDIEFPGYVALIVGAVTSEPGKNRRERNIKTYPKIAQYPEAIILKLADRIANVRNCIATQSDLLNMYRKEYPAFRLALKSDNPDVKRMWWYLDFLMSYNDDSKQSQ
jgi:(p)ppGpp synthase/HD superfamily hydrolase